MISVTKTFEFEAAHKLEEYTGPCKHLHGHSYKLEVEVSGDINKWGFVMDFSVLKRIVNESIIAIYDHSYLNDHFETPTAEIMVDNFAYEIRKFMPYGIYLERVRLYETSSSYAEWRK
jgi:6-pyruvoyltetrahydropterin/6-carboxytetrahydropterin synthase